MDPGTRSFRRKPAIEEAPLQGELMLFDPDSSRFYVLNRTMAFVWRRCDGAHSVASMAEGMDAEFSGVPNGAVEEDLRAALNELVALGLVIDG